jgi:hypothetical protein
MLAAQAPLILTTGAIARYPLGKKYQFATKTVQFADFSRQTAAQLANPLGQWVLALSLLQDSEANDWLDFFKLQQGMFSPFSFVDPSDNLFAFSEAFENSIWNNGGLSVGKNYALQSQSIGVSPWTTSESGGASLPTVTQNISSPVAPDGTQTATQIAFGATTGSESISVYQPSITPPVVASMPFTYSIFLRASASTTILIIIEDQSGAVIGTQTVSLTTSWQRFSVSGTSGGGATSLTIFINQTNSQSAKTVYSWGAQIEYGTVVSDYTLTTTSANAIQVADPFWTQAVSAVGASFGLNSGLPKRGRQIVQTASGSGNDIFQQIGIAPGGSGNSRTFGMQFTLSVWLKSGSSSPQVDLFLEDTYGSLGLGSESVFEAGPTPTSSWVRSSQTGRFSVSNPASGIFAGFLVPSSSQGTTFYMFGAQLEAAGTMSKYKDMQTSYCGFHPKCFFQTDEFDQNVSEFNVNSLQLVIEESN